MRKRQRRAAGAVIGALVCAVLGGCAGSVSEKAAPAQTEIVFEEITLSDGVYQAEFDTDSSMFHVNEACDGKGTLTVADGKMTIFPLLQKIFSICIQGLLRMHRRKAQSF